MKVYLYHSGNKHITCITSYKTLKGAMNACKRSMEFWKNNNVTWMYCWISE